jgi:hypothetical protein
MTQEERDLFWQAIESGDNPLLSVMSGLVEKWGMPAVIMSLGDIGRVLSEDAIDADLTPNQRGLVLSACAQVCNLSDHMHAEMQYIATNK